MRERGGSNIREIIERRRRKKKNKAKILFMRVLRLLKQLVLIYFNIS